MCHHIGKLSKNIWHVPDHILPLCTFGTYCNCPYIPFLSVCIGTYYFAFNFDPLAPARILKLEGAVIAASVNLSAGRQMFVLSWLCFYVHPTRPMHVMYLPLRSGLRECWLAYCELRCGVVRIPDIFGMLHFTCFVLGHIK